MGYRYMKANYGAAQAGARVDWVDYAKGLCIVFVVMMHSTLGVEAAVEQPGWMHAFVQFAKPFRMPDFFMISGLFLGLVIARPWPRYLDRKAVHFAYFYVLWVTIQFAFKAPLWLAEGQTLRDVGAGYALSFVQPFGTLWFIYLLPVFFIVTRLLNNLPRWVLLCAAALLEMLPVHTGWLVADEFASRYIYFLIGFIFAARIFDLAAWGRRNPAISLALLGVWFLVNLWATFTPVPTGFAQWRDTFHYISDLPLISLVLGCAGAIAIVNATALLSGLRWFGFLGYLGRHSIVIYLAFFFPMVVSRIIVLKFAPFLDIGTISLLVTASGVAGPVIAHALITRAGIGRFLFERPQWARIEKSPLPVRSASLRPAE